MQRRGEEKDGGDGIVCGAKEMFLGIRGHEYEENENSIL